MRIATLHDSKKFFAFLGVCFIALIFCTGSADALSGSSFRAGNIIDDSVFYNKTTMDPHQIQQFLNTKLPSCDTNGDKSITYRFNSSPLRVGEQGDPYVTTSRAVYGQRYQAYWNSLSASVRNPISPQSSAPYRCITTYTQSIPTVINSGSDYCGGNIGGGTKSAAQIIYDVAQACGINPQTLIVLIQKEQSLITDDAPWGRQYDSATGYGCPDTAPCNSEYYGFFNQTYQAAKAFKRYQANPTNYNYRAGRNNTILYNPNTGCGSSQVFIENQATANLYIYTPYRPNAAALNNLYGSGDGCSSYGNRNFWRFFNDWFGPTNGPLVRTPESGALYYTDGTYKHAVSSMELASEYGYGLGDVRFVSQSYIDQLVTPTNRSLSYVAKSDSDSDADGGNLYLVSRGSRHLITSMEQLSTYDLSASNISLLPYSQMQRLPLRGNLSNFAQAPSGFVYRVQAQKKQGIFQNDYYNQLNPSGSVSPLSNFVLSEISTGNALLNKPLPLRDQSGKIWYATPSGWHYISSMDVVGCLGINVSKLISFTPQQSTIGQQITPATCVARTSGGSVYLLDNSVKYPALSAWGSIPSVNMDDSIINAKTTRTVQPNTTYKQSNGALYIIQAGFKRYIDSMASFHELGLPESSIVTTKSGALSSIQTGVARYASRTTLQDSSNGKLYLVENDTLRYIPSMEIFRAYGLGSVRSISPSLISKFVAGDTLVNMGTITESSETVLIDAGVTYVVPTELRTHYNMPVSNQIASRATPSTKKQATRFLKDSSSPMLYYLDAGTRHPVHSWNRFVELGGSNSNITTLSSWSINRYPVGSTY